MDTQLLFLHGGPGLPEYLERFFGGRFPAGLSPSFYRQRRGGDVTVDLLVDELASRLRPGRAILVGHSWGGALALEFLRRRPGSAVAGVVLIDSFLSTHDITVEFQRELARLGLTEPGLNEIFFTPEEVALAPTLGAELWADMDHEGFKALSESVLAAYDARAFVRGLDLPVLNVFGARDVRIPARVIREYAKLNPLIENVEVPDAGHFPFVTPAARGRVVDAINRFAGRI